MAKAETIPYSKVRAKMMREPEFREAIAEPDPKFEIYAALTRARAESGLSQLEVARRMGTSQPAVARIEAGTHSPTLSTLRAYVEALGAKLEIRVKRRRKA